ncbi:hypothetical protein QC402_RS26590, partial [Escherichia coli]
GAQKSFSDVRGSNRVGGVISSLRGVTRRFTRGLRGAFRPSFFLLRTVFSWWVMSGDEYFLLSGE